MDVCNAPRNYCKHIYKSPADQIDSETSTTTSSLQVIFPYLISIKGHRTFLFWRGHKIVPPHTDLIATFKWLCFPFRTEVHKGLLFHMPLAFHLPWWSVAHQELYWGIFWTLLLSHDLQIKLGNWTWLWHSNINPYGKVHAWQESTTGHNLTQNWEITARALKWNFWFHLNLLFFCLWHSCYCLLQVPWLMPSLQKLLVSFSQAKIIK